MKVDFNKQVKQFLEKFLSYATEGSRVTTVCYVANGFPQKKI